MDSFWHETEQHQRHEFTYSGRHTLRHCSQAGLCLSADQVRGILDARRTLLRQLVPVQDQRKAAHAALLEEAQVLMLCTSTIQLLFMLRQIASSKQLQGPGCSCVGVGHLIMRASLHTVVFTIA